MSDNIKKVNEYLRPRRIVEPKIVNNTYAENIARNIEKHRRQNAMIEADRARELEVEAIERDLFTRNYEKPKIVEPAINMLKNNSAAPFKLPHQSKAAPNKL